MSILNLVDQVASVVNELKVGGWLEIECPPDLVPCGLQLDQMLELREVLQMNELVVGDVDILKVLVLIDALYQLACLRRYLPQLKLDPYSKWTESDRHDVLH